MGWISDARLILPPEIIWKWYTHSPFSICTILIKITSASSFQIQLHFLCYFFNGQIQLRFQSFHCVAFSFTIILTEIFFSFLWRASSILIGNYVTLINILISFGKISFELRERGLFLRKKNSSSFFTRRKYYYYYISK